jgi:2-dehydropantoate 2-reductase
LRGNCRKLGQDRQSKGAWSVRIAIMGSGGVGGYFGARLAKGGADVTFIARGAHLAALRDQGLTVESTDESIRLPKVQATDDPGGIGPVDVVLFCVKLRDTEAAARALRPIIRPGSAVLSLQNGVQKDDTLRAIFGESAVMGGVAYVATTIARPGVIAQTGALQRMVFGEYDAPSSARAEALLDACKRGGINAELSGDVRRAIWEKYVFLVGLSGATAVMRSPIGPIRENPLSRQFLFDLMREAVAVGRAHGVALPEDFAEKRMAFVDTLPRDMTSSMHHDLENRRPLEVQWLAGGVVALGAAVGVPTPANRAVHDILALHAAGQ